MFCLLVSVRVQPEYRAEFLTAIESNARASVAEEPGCLRFDVCQDTTEENHFLFYEIYRDESAFAQHRETPHFADWRRAAQRCLVPGTQVNTSSTLLFSES